MAELGVGYISIVPEVSKISPGIAKALGAAEPQVEKSGDSMGSKLSSGISRKLKASAIGIGTAAGGSIAAGLTKGFGRLKAIEGAEAKLKGLGNSAETVSGVMDNALAAVKGTAHGLGEAASVSAQMVAAGIKPGKELEQTLTTVGDTAAIAGRSMEDMGLIFGSVAARGKLQGDDMLQLMSAGIPVLQLLADQLGVTSAEVSDMVSEGEVDFATFEKAMREGMGGAAQDMGNTFSGALANMGAAAGRVGATTLKPFFGLAKDGFGAVTVALDGLNDRLGPVMEDFGNWIQNRGVPAVKEFGSSLAALGQSAEAQTMLQQTKDAFTQMWEAGQKMAPAIGSIISALGQASAALGVSTWTVFVSLLQAAGSAIEALSGPLQSVTGFLEQHPGLVTAAVAAWAGFKTVPTIFDKINGVVQPHVDSLKTMGQGVKDIRAYYADTGREISRFDAAVQYAGTSTNKTMQSMAQAYTQASVPLKDLASSYRSMGQSASENALKAGNSFTSMDYMMQSAGRSVQASVTSMAGTISGVGAAAFSGLKSGVTNVVNALGGPLAVGIGATVALYANTQHAAAALEAAQEAMAQATRESAVAQQELRAQLAGTTGELDDQALASAAKVAKAEFSELIEMGGRDFGIVEKLNMATVSVDNFMNKIPLMASEEQKARAASTTHNKELKESYEALSEAAEKSNIPMEALSEVVAKGGPEYQKLISSLRESGEAGNAAADQLEGARAKVEGLVESAQRVDPAAAQAAHGIEVLADAGSSAEEKLTALESVLQAMGLAPKDAEKAMMDAADAVDKLVESTQSLEVPANEMGAALFNADGSLEVTNDSARQLYEQMTTLHDQMVNVAVNGGDVQGTFDNQISPALDVLAEKFGLSKEQVASLCEQFGLMPEEIQTVVNVNSEGVSSELASIYAALYDLEEGQTIEVPLAGDEAMAVLDELGIKTKDLGNGNMEITATTDEAEEALSHITQLMSEIGETDISPEVFMDTTQLEVSAGEAKGILDALDIENPSPQAQLIIDNLLNGKGIAQGELDALGAMSPTPKADLNKKLLDNGVSLSNRALDQLGVKKTTPTIDVNNRPAASGIEAVKGWLAGIKDKVVNIFTHRHDNAADGLVNYAAAQRFMAAGGAQRMSQQPAQIQPGGRWLTWAEDETQGESFIPHAPSKRKRSTQILAETAGIFGLGLVDAGGNQIRRDGSSVAPKSVTHMADGGVSAHDVLKFVKGETVDGKRAPRSLEGASYVWSGGLLGNWGDCSGAMSGIGAFIAGWPLAGRKFATGDEGAVLARMGAKNGLGSGARMAFGWFNGGPWGGHTAGTLFFGDGKRINLEMGGGRGNGQIGGAAAGADNGQFTNRAYLPLDGGVDIGFSDVDGTYDKGGPLEGISSTSTSGYTTKSGKSVSWGKAQEYYDMALEFQKRTRVHDRGGIMKDGRIAINMSGRDERILNPMETVAYERSLDVLPKFAASFNSAVNQFVKGANGAQYQAAKYGRNFGGDYLASAEIVQDAEQGLLDTRRAIAAENDDVVQREKELAEAKRELAEVEKEGGGLSKAEKRKLADAEENLAKARREGKPDKIADAEKKLARTREDVNDALEKSKDKNAKAVKSAQDKVNKAEDALGEAREKTADQSDRLIAAERAVAAARYKAAGDMAESIFESASKGFISISNFFDEMERLAGIVERTRQEVSKMEMQQQTNAIERLRSLAELQLREQDVARARARGALSVAEAEADLEDARDAAARMGSTSIEAMSGAMDRFRRTGIFAVEEVSESVIENSAEVKAAEWGVKVARAQAALDEFEATRQQALAQLDVAQATLTQTAAAKMLTLQTQQLQAQAAQLYGMTANQASGAARGFGGVGKVTGGLGKVIGGILAGVAGFAAGGPLGALAGAGLALGGLKDTVQGSIDIHQNKKEMGEAWKNLDAGSKAGIILGAGGGLALGAAGGALSGQYGTEMATAGADLGAQFTEATIGSLQYAVAGKIDKLQRESEDQTAALQRQTDRDQLALDMLKAQNEVDYITKKDVLESNLEYAKLQQDLAKAQNEGVIKALQDASKVEQERASQAHVEQMGIISDTNKHLQELVTLTRNDAGANTETGKQLAAAVGGINKLLVSLSARPLSTADGNRFAESRI